MFLDQFSLPLWYLFHGFHCFCNIVSNRFVLCFTLPFFCYILAFLIIPQLGLDFLYFVHHGSLQLVSHSYGPAVHGKYALLLKWSDLCSIDILSFLYWLYRIYRYYVTCQWILLLLFSLPASLRFLSDASMCLLKWCFCGSACIQLYHTRKFFRSSRKDATVNCPFLQSGRFFSFFPFSYTSPKDSL